MRFISPTYGSNKDINDILDIIFTKMRQSPLSKWTIAIGTDSQNKGNYTKICSAILLIEKGNGGIYFHSSSIVPRIKVTQTRMLKEAEISIGLGHKIIELMEARFEEGEQDIFDYQVDFEIHCDFGPNGKSKDSIGAAIGWITAEFQGQISAKTKPESLAASYVADKYTK